MRLGACKPQQRKLRGRSITVFGEHAKITYSMAAGFVLCVFIINLRTVFLQTILIIHYVPHKNIGHAFQTSFLQEHVM